jgi:high-affinity nickel-transport protein
MGPDQEGDMGSSNPPTTPRHGSFAADEWGLLGGFYGFIAPLHVVGWGLYIFYSARHPALVGLGLAAYLFGLRHAFDADPISAIDDTVRYMLQQRKRPLGIGFFFSLGHASIVFFLAVAVTFAAVIK